MRRYRIGGPVPVGSPPTAVLCVGTTVSLRMSSFGKISGDMPFSISWGDTKIHGRSTRDGRIEALVPSHLTSVRLRFGAHEGGEEYQVQIGEMPAATEIKGLQMRLQNLGYLHADVDGEMNEATRSALRHFQHEHEIETTGELDRNTVRLLRRKHP